MTTDAPSSGDTVRLITPLGLGLSVRLWGPADAPPLVLLHGFMDSAEAFAATVQSLATRWRIIAPDQRGHGRSDHVGAGGYYHFPDYVLDLAAVMAKFVSVDGPRPVVVGHSMGASVALYYAGSFPERVRGLVLIDGMGPPSGRAGDAPGLMRRWIEATETRAPQRHTLRSYPIARIRQRLSTSAPGLTEAQREAVLGARTVPAEPTTGTATDNVTYRFDRLHRTPSPHHVDAGRLDAFCAAVKAPTLAIWGQRTPFRFKEAAGRQALIADVREVTIPGAGHNIHLEQPLALGEAIAGFVDALPDVT